jgi:hypothetical protein
MAYFLKLSNDVTSKETNKPFCSPTAYSESDFKFFALENRLTGNLIEYWGHCYDHREANVTCYKIEGTQGCGGIPFPPEGLQT